MTRLHPGRILDPTDCRHPYRRSANGIRLSTYAIRRTEGKVTFVGRIVPCVATRSQVWMNPWSIRWGLRGFVRSGRQPVGDAASAVDPTQKRRKRTVVYSALRLYSWPMRPYPCEHCRIESRSRILDVSAAGGGPHERVQLLEGRGGRCVRATPQQRSTCP